MEDVTGTEDMTGVVDTMTGMKGTTAVETTRKAVKHREGKGSDSCHETDGASMKGSAARQLSVLRQT
jgi:hypothetical protein